MVVIGTLVYVTVRLCGVILVEAVLKYFDRRRSLHQKIDKLFHPKSSLRDLFHVPSFLQYSFTGLAV